MTITRFIAAIAATLCLTTAATAATVNILYSGLTAELRGRNADAWAGMKPSHAAALPGGASWALDSAIWLLPTNDFAIDAEGGDPCRNACSPFYGGTFRNPSAPATSAGGWETAPFWAVFDPQTTDLTMTNTAKLLFPSKQRALSLLWGSPDRGNQIELMLGKISVASFWGAELDWFANDIADDIENGVVGHGSVFLTLSGLDFDAVRFTAWSKTGTFEFGGVSTVAAVPVPASLLLILSGLGAIAVVGRRRRA